MKNLNKSNREHLVGQLLKAQEKHTRTWQTIFRDEDKGIPNWSSIRKQMLFEISKLEKDIDMISEVLINNEWRS